MQTPPWWAKVRLLAVMLAVIVLYFATAQLGLALAIPPGIATAVWIPSGIAVAAVLLGGKRLWPAVFLGSIASNWLIIVRPDRPLGLALMALAIIAAGSTLQTLLAAALLRHYIGSINPLRRVRDAFVFVAITVACCPVAATSGALASLAIPAPANAHATFGQNWLTWWLGDAVGILIITPLPLVWNTFPVIRFSVLRAIEVALFSALLLGTVIVVFGPLLWLGQGHYPVGFLLIPAVVWAAVRFGSRGATLVTFLVAAGATVGTVLHWGPFALEIGHSSLLLLGSFIGVIAGTALVLAAVFTERRAAEQAVRDSQEEFRRVVESTPNGLVVVNETGKIIMVNSQTERLFGYDRQELIGQRVELLVPNRFRSDHPGYRHEYQDNPQARPMGKGRDLFGRRKDGTEVPIEIGLNPVKTEKGLRVLAAIVDITERKAAEEALRDLNQTLEHQVAQRTAEAEHRANQLRALASELTNAEERERRRLALVLHDQLQQLLVAARMQLDLVGDGLENAKQIKALRASCELIDQSIRESRSLSSELSPPVLYDAGLGAALAWLGRWMGEKHGLKVEVEAHPGAEAASQEYAVLLYQAVRELLFNITKHAGVDKARVTLARSKGQLQVTVEDQGKGFDPTGFGRARGAASGLGLFSLRERLGFVGGTVAIDSAPGKGTRVTLLVPTPAAADPALAAAKSLAHREEHKQGDSSQMAAVADTAAPGRTMEPTNPPGNNAAGIPVPATLPANPVPSSPSTGGSTIRVVVADDHRIVREGLVGLLRDRTDIQVVGQAADGKMAVELARQLRPQVVIMDVSMPVMNGIEATRLITAELPATRVIGLSMHVQSDMAASMRQAGAVAYLQKDGPAQALVETIRAAAMETQPAALVD